MFLSKILRAIDHPYLFGKGGRMPNNEILRMQGLTPKSLKHHVALQVHTNTVQLTLKTEHCSIVLQPLAVIMVGGCLFVAAYLGRWVEGEPLSFWILTFSSPNFLLPHCTHFLFY